MKLISAIPIRANATGQAVFQNVPPVFLRAPIISCIAYTILYRKAIQWNESNRALVFQKKNQNGIPRDCGELNCRDNFFRKEDVSQKFLFRKPLSVSLHHILS